MQSAPRSEQLSNLQQAPAAKEMLPSMEQGIEIPSTWVVSYVVLVAGEVFGVCWVFGGA